MKTTLACRLPMIPCLTASAGKAKCMANDYLGWELLEVDNSHQEILICKPCEDAWIYTRSKHLLILCGEVAVVWQRTSAASVSRMSETTGAPRLIEPYTRYYWKIYHRQHRGVIDRNLFN